MIFLTTKIKQIEIEIRAEEERILSILSLKFKEIQKEMFENQKILVNLDVIFAKARYSIHLKANPAMIVDEKIIDIALKYGYNTPESFTRAFSSFHGITPTQARRGENIRSFSKLSVKLILSGGNTMNYRIEKKDAFKVVCRRKQITKPQGDIATEAISSF